MFLIPEYIAIDPTTYISGDRWCYIMALSIVIVTTTFPGKERGKALGNLGSVIFAGVLIGPVVGGLL